MNKVKLPSNEVILYVLALGGALTFSYAFLVMDGANLLSVAGVLLLARGLVIGAAAGLGMAKISHALPRALKTNKPFLWAAFIAFMIVTPLIISPITFAKMAPDMMTLPVWVRVMVAISAGVFVDALTAGVAFASGKLEADDKPAITAQGETTSETKPVKAKGKPAFVCSCGYEAKSQAGLNGHKLAHKQKEAAVVGYELNMKPITKEQAAK